MTATFVCTTADVDERVQQLPTTERESSVRDLVLSLWDVVESAKNIMLWNRSMTRMSGCRSLQDFRALLMYAVEAPSRRRRTPMDVPEMVTRWVPIIRGLATAHDKAPLDQCEFEMEAHLNPLLTAPVKQIREFYEQLVIALKGDASIPFFVWAWFESWGEVMLKRAPDGEVKELKSALAAEIATMVEAQVQPDLKQAMAAALQWRSPESLEKIKAAVATGGKARMVGRESCLFLEVETSDGLARVML
jgi:hypothetical protein